MTNTEEPLADPDETLLDGARDTGSSITVEQQLSVLYTIARAFAEAERLEDTAPLVLRTLAEALDWEVAGLWVQERPGILRCAAVHIADARLDRWMTDALARRVPIGRGVPGRVWASGQPVWIRDTDSLEDFPRRDIARAMALRHGFAFPIRVHGSIAAVLELFAAKVRDIDSDQARFLEGVGHQLGSFMGRIEARHDVAVGEARKGGILSAAVDAIVSADRGGRILEFNRAAEQLFGLARDEVLGRTIADMLVPDDLVAGHVAGLARYVATGEARILGQRVRSWAKRADGSRLPIELTVTEIRLEDEPMFTAFIRDIRREREAEIARDRFLEILSHELRTPVTSIFGGAQVLARRALDDGQRAELVHDISAEADRLYRLVEDLIVLARAERGALAIALEPVHLERVAERVVRDFRLRWPGIAFEMSVDGVRGPVQADETYVEQLLRNLLSNAVKYGGEGGVVEVSIDHSVSEARTRVLDRGPGVHPSDTSRLFEIDYRSPLTQGMAEGSGIGLFVARWLAEGMGGRIWTAPREGGGSEFGFALQAVDADAGIAEPTTAGAAPVLEPLELEPR
ncbi:MAG: GAF domain-containing sensor histidine kinase [Chloroflexota bacterium]|nr:GAF domain-containing sensor histidine kinase [Chloroflexota bacterium]